MLLFLHGFLGQKEDWDPLLAHLQKPAVAVDLPGHGTAPMGEDIALAVHQQLPRADFLIGYSAGGRIALELQARFPENYKRIILLSAHPGLKSEEEKQKRWETDCKWSAMLLKDGIEPFLEKWYGQELFNSLRKSPDFPEILKRRKQQSISPLANFLLANSVARKNPREIPPSAILLYGEEDLKYERLYRTLDRTNKVYCIKNAGHALHLENPKECARIIQKEIDDDD